jgi:phage/plasmid-like protein (TIGR03299 family)
MIDQSNGRTAFAFAGQPAWHRLGTQLLPTDTPEEQLVKAGLDYTVLEAETTFRRLLKRGENGAADEFEVVPFAGKKTLYRSDTGAPLSIMSDGYHAHQPRQIFALYQEIARVTGFTLETAGGLDDGKRIWALLRVNEGADIVNRDRVRPYILLATSYDGTMATIAKFTAVRVVCHNTISMSVGYYNARTGQMEGGERDDVHPGREQAVRVLHSTKWTDEVAKKVRMTLGIAADAFERFTIEARAMAGITMTDNEAHQFCRDLLEPYFKASKAEKARVKDVRDTKGYRRIMALFAGEAAGAEMVGKDRWAMLNAVTQFVDHERGLTDSKRVEQAWFGFGSSLKDRAFEMLREKREPRTVDADARLAA